MTYDLGAMTDFFSVPKKSFTPVNCNTHPGVQNHVREVADRDEITLDHFRICSFIRMPYDDLEEVEMLPELDVDEPVFAFFVSTMLTGGEHARIPLTHHQFNELKPKVAFVSLKNQKQT